MGVCQAKQERHRQINAASAFLQGTALISQQLRVACAQNFNNCATANY
jgi:hypothetical protein